jgi:cytochrome c5
MRPIILLLASLALPAFAAERSGAEVYESTCSECHAKANTTRRYSATPNSGTSWCAKA